MPPDSLYSLREDRRRLLARTESLLGAVEEINLAGGSTVPEDLVRALVEAAATVEAADGLRRFRRLRGTVDTDSALSFLFGLQDRILGSPEQGSPTVASDRPLKVRTHLVKLEDAPSDAEWRRWLKGQAQRAWDRWSLVDEQARRAERQVYCGEEEERRWMASIRGRQAAGAKLEWEAMRDAVSVRLGVRFQPDTDVVLRASGTRLTGMSVTVDLGTGRISTVGEEFRLTGREAHVLSLLVSQPGRLFSREAMTRSIHADDPRLGPDSRVIDVHMVRIRNKIGPLSAHVVTVPWVGYEWTGPAAVRPRALLDRSNSCLRTVDQTVVPGSSPAAVMESRRPAARR